MGTHARRNSKRRVRKLRVAGLVSRRETRISSNRNHIALHRRPPSSVLLSLPHPLQKRNLLLSSGSGLGTVWIVTSFVAVAP